MIRSMIPRSLQFRTSVRGLAPRLLLPLLFGCAPALFLSAQEAPRLDFEQGDRIAFLGNTFTERSQRSSHIEAAFTLAMPDKDLVFRNLGWSGDNVYGEARKYFGDRKEGYSRLLNHVDLAKPDIIIAHYGANAAFAGAAKIPEFVKQYGTLIDDLKKRTPRIVLVSPPPHEKHPPFIDDPSAHNAVLAQVRDAIKKLAAEKNVVFSDLYERASGTEGRTENGVHYSPAGYRALASDIIGAPLPDTAEYRAFCKQIRAKNNLFFHQYRPQNETYLRGFRKHEQGQNAKELPQFDAHIAELETAIHKQARNIREAN